MPTNLIIRHRYGPGPTVALNAHGDVVIEEANAHRADERVRPADLFAATRVVALADLLEG